LSESLKKLKEVLVKAGVKATNVVVDDHPPKRSTLTFAYQDWHHPALKRLRAKFRLDKVVKPGKSEFEKMLLLRKWVHDTIPFGTPADVPLEAEAIIDCALKGGTFWCSHYAWVYMSCAIALGWQARKLGIDSFHTAKEDSTHHGVAEIWSNQFAKWFVVDPMYDIHYELDGMPLSAYEVRSQILKNGCTDVETRKGPGRRKTAKGATKGPFDSPMCYFWFLVATRNDFFSMPERYGNYRSLLLKDSANKSHVWYQGSGSKGQSSPHSHYQGKFLDTENINDVYPEIGMVEFIFKESKLPGEVAVSTGHFTPNFSHLLVEINGKAQKVIGDEFTWRLCKGRNNLVVRTVNLAGVQGYPSSARITVKG
jgi:hypothetical protein